MFVIKRNQIIITALVVMIGIAGYLNYVDNPNKKDNTPVMANESDLAVIPNEEETDILALDDTGKLIAFDEDNAILSEYEAEEMDAIDNTGDAVFVNADDYSVEFFANAKLDREQARSKEKDILLDVINNENIEKEKKGLSADSMLKLHDRIEKETSAEAMIEAKGFKDAYVRIDDETVDVVVSKKELTAAEIAQIEDIVKRKTGMSVDQIRIVPLKSQ